MDNRFKIEFFQDNTYSVLERCYEGSSWRSYGFPPITTSKEIPTLTWDKIFQGTLPECEAFIKLKEGGYM